MEGYSPVGTVGWSDVFKPNQYDYYGITLEFKPKADTKAKEFFQELKAYAAQALTGEGAKKPYWQKKDDPEVYCLNFSTKFEITKWFDKKDKSIEAPKGFLRGTQVQIKFKAMPNKSKTYLNLYLEQVKIVAPPNAENTNTNEATDGEDGEIFL